MATAISANRAELLAIANSVASENCTSAAERAREGAGPNSASFL